MANKITMETIDKILTTLPANEGQMVVAELYRRAFELVAPRPNWKAPINSALLCPDEYEYAPQVIAEAVGFMTGAAAEIIEYPDGTVRLKAPGYYATTGA